jgi:hypothetical protein
MTISGDTWLCGGARRSVAVGFLLDTNILAGRFDAPASGVLTASRK